MSGVDELLAWQYGVDLVSARRPVVVLLNMTERRMAIDLSECVAAARQTLGHDTIARWVCTGADDAVRARGSADRPMEL
jgi:hypothetical protein